jgi:L-threonylcarbamoyladenylate synthase
LAAVDHRVRLAAATVAAGGVIAYPTEAIWGLGCDPFNEAAVDRLLRLKRRPREKGLILVAGEIEQFRWLLRDLSAQQMARLSGTWPGPVTWLVPHHGRVPTWISGDHPTVALRVSAHMRVRELCLAVGGPLVSTSANIGGAAPARFAFQVRRYFGTGIDYLLPGPLGGADSPSMIRDLDSDTILRP